MTQNLAHPEDQVRYRAVEAIGSVVNIQLALGWGRGQRRSERYPDNIQLTASLHPGQQGRSGGEEGRSLLLPQ